MADPALDDAYHRFSEMWADGRPVRGPRELGAAIRASALPATGVGDEWLRSLRRAWVYGESDEPFEDFRANRIYLRELNR